MLAKGGAQYVYQVCVAGDASNCFSAVTITFQPPAGQASRPARPGSFSARR